MQQNAGRDTHTWSSQVSQPRWRHVGAQGNVLPTNYVLGIRCKHPYELNEGDIGGVGKVLVGVIVIKVMGWTDEVYIQASSKAEYRISPPLPIFFPIIYTRSIMNKPQPQS